MVEEIMEKGSLKVSVLMITYNHEKLISQAIEGVIIQKSNFNVELIISDDFSTDRTRNTIEKYLKHYPDLIKPLFQKMNLGAMNNFLAALSLCSGKYIALCEGDDYWTDPSKLYTQVGFLEENPEFSLCFHDALVSWDDNSKKSYLFCKDLSKSIFTIEDVINGWFVPSASMVFRKDLLYPLPSWLKEIYNGDYALQLLLIRKGNFYFINKQMSIYRQHKTNFSTTVNGTKINDSLIQLFLLYNEYTSEQFNEQIKSRLKKLYRSSRKIRIKRAFLMIPFGKLFWQPLTYIFRGFKKK